MAKTAPTNAVGLLAADGASWALSTVSDELILDRFWMAYIILYLMGVSSLLPWNALITPVEYLKLRVDGSAFAHSIESALSISFTTISFLTLVCLQRLQNFIPLRTRILTCLFTLLAIFGVLAGCAIAPLSVDDAELVDELKRGASTQVIVIVAGAALCGIAQGILTGSAMSYAALFARPRYLQAISGGQGIAGLTIAIGSLLFRLPSIAHDCASPATPGKGVTPTHARELTTSAVVYFLAVCLIVVLAIFGFLLIERLPFTRARKRLNAHAVSQPVDSLSPLEAGGAIGTSDVVTMTTAAQQQQPAASDAAAADAAGGGTCALLASLWKWAFSVALVYTVTIGIFPSLTSTLMAAPVNGSSGGDDDSSSSMGLSSSSSSSSSSSTNSALDGGLLGAVASGECEWAGIFVPLTFVMFNLGDTIGRNLPCIVRSPNAILASVVARVVFAPLFMLCHTSAHGPLELPLFWGTDAMPFVFILIFSITNGMFTSSVFVASQGVVEPKQRDAAASMLVMSLNFGIWLGASLQFVVLYVNCTPSEANGYSCNPFVEPAVNTTVATTFGGSSPLHLRLP